MKRSPLGRPVRVFLAEKAGVNFSAVLQTALKEDGSFADLPPYSWY